MNFQQRLLQVIPGGAHTYSRGYDQHPSNAPSILSFAKGAYCFDPDGRRYLDYGMALRAVGIGYAEDEIDEAAIRQLRMGNNLTRPSLIELEAAEALVNLIDSVDMVKFTKNGSTSVSAAVKLARAYTGRELIVRCSDHPFFSYDDWFIGSTPVRRGIPRDTIDKTKLFQFNNLGSLEQVVAQYHGQVACVVLEPAATEEPAPGFLQGVVDLCRRHGIVSVFDEMITGFRWHLKGAQYLYGVAPDLCTFGKSMANGYSVSCVAGRRELMELGSIEREGNERVFLLSTTHGAEMCGLGAFVATKSFLERENVIAHLWEYGNKLMGIMRQQAKAAGVEESFKVNGVPCSPWYSTLDATGAPSLALRTLFMQEMIRNGVLIPWIALCYRHGDDELRITENALQEAFKVYRKALDGTPISFLEGPPIKPVFRQYN